MRLFLLLASVGIMIVADQTESVAEVKLRKVLDYIRTSGQEKLDQIIASTSNSTQSVAKQIISTIGNSSLKGDAIKAQVVSLYNSAAPAVKTELDGVYSKLQAVLGKWVQGKKGAGMLWETTPASTVTAV